MSGLKIVTKAFFKENKQIMGKKVGHILVDELSSLLLSLNYNGNCKNDFRIKNIGQTQFILSLMCGIAGYKTNHNIEPTVLDNMVSALIHRGPDSSGYYKDEYYNAGMRRLSINGIESGNQPLFNQNKNVVLLYNGEIYNSLELRKDLQKKGYKFKTNSDGEVICHLFDEYQEECFDKLDGMFAIAMWIVDQRKLFLSRDLAGEKPLYYSCLSHNEIFFRSEIKILK